MQPNPYHTLSPAEREELALCGISSEDQLLKATATQLCRDLQQARNFFPDKTFTLTPEKIHSLFPETGLPEKSADAPLPGWRSAAPVAEFRSRSRSSRNSETHRTNKQPFMPHSPVRCTHRATAILAAFCTLFLLIPLGSVVVFPYLMLTDNMPDVPLWLLAVIVFVVPCIVYMFIARRATCPVCHMRIFRYAHYTRNRAAHHLPLLGYNFATALHLLFFWRYNCPGCGTPIKLLGVKGHRTQC